MPIDDIPQPNYLVIDSDLRLTAYDGAFAFAFDWYQDKESLELIDGKGEAVPYTMKRLQNMYEYLNRHGELYFIEKRENEKYIPIGDVTFWKGDMPIVIAREYRRKGIGKRVVLRLIERAKEIGYSQIYIKQIYHDNVGSQKLFTGCGFIKSASTEEGASYSLTLNSNHQESGHDAVK